MLAEQALGQRRQRLLDLNPYEDVTFPLGIMRGSDPV